MRAHPRAIPSIDGCSRARRSALFTTGKTGRVLDLSLPSSNLSEVLQFVRDCRVLFPGFPVEGKFGLQSGEEEKGPVPLKGNRVEDITYLVCPIHTVIEDAFPVCDFDVFGDYIAQAAAKCFLRSVFATDFCDAPRGKEGRCPDNCMTLPHLQQRARERVFVSSSM